MYDADEDWERPEWTKAYNKYYENMVKAKLIGFLARPEWTKAYNKYYENMVKAKLIGFLAICLIFWGNIAAIAVSVISLYFSFKYILLKKAECQ